jgi:WS/DGAT/MGAT family acyltransferase
MLTQLTEQDAAFLYLETQETPAHVGGLSLVELPDGYPGSFFEGYKATIASRLPLIPFMHRKLAPIPLDLDRPFWVEDEHVDLDYHVRHLTAPSPGTMKELEALVALLHAHPLDRSRPLWEFYVIDGLSSGQQAIYTKMHHAAMDGAASQALIATMYDPTLAPRTFPVLVSDSDQRGTVGNLVKGLLAARARRAIRAIEFLPQLAGALAHLVLPDAKTLRYRAIPRMPRSAKTLFNVGITNQRVYAARTLPLPVVKQIARASKTKVNDVVLAICSGALRAYLQDRHATPARSLTAGVPISARDTADLTTANLNGMLVCSLASDIADPTQRLLAIHRSTIQQKQLFDRLKEFPVPDVRLPGIGAIARTLVESYGRSRWVGRPPLVGNLVISNVPGPAQPMYIAGAKLVSMFPCSIPFHGQALNITVESYCDRLDVGLIACRSAVPDIALLGDRLSVALEELRQAVTPDEVAPMRPSVLATPPEVPALDDRVVRNGKSRFAGAMA